MVYFVRGPLRFKLGQMKPLAIDLFCGLGGWAEGFIAEGYDVVGFDIERHNYGTGGYPGQLVLQDVLTLEGRQFRNAAVIVASPPCQAYSYMAMPWSLAKAKAAAIREDVRLWLELTCLFNTCFRIVAEAGVPLVVENVRGAQPWVGRAKAHFGSFYLWGDVPAQMPTCGVALKWGGCNGKRFDQRPKGNVAAHREGTRKEGLKINGYSDPRRNGGRGVHLMNPRENEQGIKQHGSGSKWFDQGIANMSSAGLNRKAASAQIAKIPFPLAQYIARVFKQLSQGPPTPAKLFSTGPRRR